MQITVNNRLGVALADSGNFTAFDLRVDAGVARESLAAALQGIADVEGEHAWVREQWLLDQLARTPPSSQWRESFDGMAAFARRKGWMRDGPPAIRAHIVTEA